MQDALGKAKKVLMGGKGESARVPGFKLLPDRPLDADREEDMRFGHKELVGTIYSVLRGAEPPFVVALYGKWGTGKTTIATSVARRATQEGFAHLFFDAWKYKQDSLRRQFLIELDEQIFKGRLNYKKELSQSLTKQESLSIREFFGRIVRKPSIQIISIIAIALFVGLFIETGSYTQVINALFSIGILGLFVSFLLASFQEITGSITEHRTDSAEGFEAHFKNAFKERELSGKTLLVVIDNLDRIEAEAVKVLSDIKTFLSQDHDVHQRVLFLIPCDDGALRSQLNETYGEEFDADEFLRKFFNLTIKIPLFIDLELLDYVRDLLREAGVQEFRDNHDLEGVLTAALRNNPREIKQFINSLIPLILLARQRQLNVVLANVAFLAKLLLLRQKFPILYGVLEEEALKTHITLDDETLIEAYQRKLKMQQFGEEAIVAEIERFTSFNQYTPVNEKNIDAFLTLRQLDEERKIPEWTSYVVAAESGDEESTGKIVVNIKKNGKKEVFGDFLKTRIEKLRRGPNAVLFVATTLKTLWEAKMPLRQFFDAAANHFPYGDNLEKNYTRFEPRMVFEFWYPNTSKSMQPRIVHPFVHILGTEKEGSTALDEDYVEKLMQAIGDNPELFLPHKQVVRKHIASHLYTTPYILCLNKDAARKAFISKEAAGKFVDSLERESFEDETELHEILDFWSKLPLEVGAVLNSFKKYRELAQALNSSGSDEEKATLTRSLFSFTRRHKDLLESAETDNSVDSELSTLSTTLVGYFDQAEQDKRIDFIPVIDLYSTLSRNNGRSVLESKINEFIRQSDDAILKKSGKQRLQNWATRFPGAVVQRSQQNPAVLMELELYKVLETNHIQALVDGMLTNGLNPGRLLEATAYRVDNPDVVINNIIQNIARFEVKEVRELVGTLRKLGIDQYAARVDELKNALMRYKNDHPSDAAEITKIARQRGLFNSAQRAELERVEES